MIVLQHKSYNENVDPLFISDEITELQKPIYQHTYFIAFTCSYSFSLYRLSLLLPIKIKQNVICLLTKALNYKLPMII